MKKKPPPSGIYLLLITCFSISTAFANKENEEPIKEQEVTCGEFYKTDDAGNQVINGNLDAHLRACNLNRSDFEARGERLYKFVNTDHEDFDKFPYTLKCSPWDKRNFKFCLKIDLFKPSPRVYFDTEDNEIEADIFNDGEISATIDFISIYTPLRLGRNESYDPWAWGPIISAGIGTPSNSEDTEGSGAPVVLLSAGMQLRYTVTSVGNQPSFAFEHGMAWGYSADEAFNDKEDKATYFGIRIDIPTNK